MRPKGVADGKQVNIPVLVRVRFKRLRGRGKLGRPGDGCPGLKV